MAYIDHLSHWFDSLPIPVLILIWLGILVLALFAARLYIELLANRDILFTRVPNFSAVLIECNGEFDHAILKWGSFYYNDPRRSWYQKAFYPKQWDVLSTRDKRTFSAYDHRLLRFIETLGFCWIGFGKTVYARITEPKYAVRNAFDVYSELKTKQRHAQAAQLAKENAEWQRKLTEEQCKAHDPEEISKRDRQAKKDIIEAEFTALKPSPPPPKSKRLTETERVERETSWFSNAVFACMMLFVPVSIIIVPLLKAMGGFFIFLLLVVFGAIIIGYRINFESDGNKKRLSAQRYDEDKKWAAEDAAWINYEAALKQWQEQKRERIARIDAMHTDHRGVSNLATDIINHLKL